MFKKYTTLVVLSLVALPTFIKAMEDSVSRFQSLTDYREDCARAEVQYYQRRFHKNNTGNSSPFLWSGALLNGLQKNKRIGPCLDVIGKTIHSIEKQVEKSAQSNSHFAE